MKPWLVTLIALTGNLAHGQDVTVKQFDVASVKRSAPGSVPGGGGLDPGRLVLPNITLRACILLAYQVADYQLVTPAWAESERYDIQATMRPHSSESDIWLMLQALLIERFQMASHHEKKEMSVYALAPTGSTPRLAPKSDCTGSISFSRQSIVAKCNSMEALAAGLMRQADRPVVNMTGLTGNYEFTLTWTPDETRAPLFQALKQQLGLKLEPRRLPIDVLVIDHANKTPTEN
jgi:uncharacterized protein (TIGR03435 family)